MLKQRALWQSTMREISYSLPRFISILLMITLGAFIFVGLLTIGPTIDKTLYSYVERYEMADLTIHNPIGLDENDRRMIEQLEGVRRYTYAYQVDQVVAENGDVLALESIAAFPTYDIRSGRLPERPQEIALSEQLRGRYVLGQSIHLNNGAKDADDQLAFEEFVVSGFVATTENLSPTEVIDTTAYGDGGLDGFAVLLPEVFLADHPTLARLDFNDVASVPIDSEKYKEMMKIHVRQIEDLFANRPDLRLDTLFNDAADQIARGNDDLDLAEERLDDGMTALDAASRELQTARRSLSEGQRDLSDGIQQGLREIQDGAQNLSKTRQTLSEAEQAILEGELALQAGQRTVDRNRTTLTQARRSYENAVASYDTSKRTFEEGQNTLRASAEELNAGKTALAQGEADYQNGVNELTANRQKLENAKAAYQSGTIALQNGQAQLAAARDQLQAGRSQLDDQKRLLDQQKIQLDALRQAYEFAAANDDPSAPILEAQLQSAQSQYSSALALWQINQNAWEANQAALTAKSSELQQIGNTLRSSQIEMANAENAIRTGTETLEAARLQLEDSRRKVQDGQRAYDDGVREAEQGRLALQQAETQLNQAKRELDSGMAALDAAQVRVDENRRSLQAARQNLDTGKKQWQAGYDQLQQGRSQLSWQQEQGQRELTQALDDILAGEAAYYDNLDAYFAAYPEAREDIRSGKEDLAESAEDLQRLMVPEYTIRDQALDPMLSNYAQFGQSIRLMARIFPVFFYLIALLVTLTTMTRMVEDDRGQIGTLKALGYNSPSIMRKYVVYGSAAAVLGTIIGAVLGYKFLMPIIWEAYSVNYVFKTYEAALSPWVLVVTLLVDLACTALAALFSVQQNLRQNVATLLRPKTPEGGNRILLERIRPVWQRLSFNQKITFRNLFRYKKRMSMTIIGVAGCMGLITMGLGLDNSITGVFDRQFNDLNHYDAIAVYDSNASNASIEDYRYQLNRSAPIEHASQVRYENGIFPVDNSSDQTLTIITPMDPESFSEVVFLDAKSGAPLDLSNGPIISEKTARILNLEPGDAISYKDSFGDWQRLPIGGIVENYIGHNLYMHPDDYFELFGKNPKPNADYIQLANAADITAFTEHMLQNKIALTVIKTSTTNAFVNNLTGSLGVVVSVIIVASMLLALVVLYNLTNINVEERLRELSTIKVLGFYPLEVTAYIYRETFALTLIGIGIGIGVGKFLHTLICRAMSPPIFLMMEEILPQNYLAAAMFTFITSLLVMLIMHRKMQRVDMVQALKGVE